MDYMGTDSSIVQAARVSYGRGTKRVTEDAGLIHYLMRHRHTTPFEMCEIKFHVKMPIFVARQWIRHRTASVNEYSGRYSVMNKEFYVPAPEHLATQSTSNRQGREENNVLEGEAADKILRMLREDGDRCYEHYEEMLEEDGLARELARMNLTLNHYTQWYWKIDLHNLMHFLSLRADSHAQYEIRVYAETMLDILQKWVPITHAAFMEYRLGGVTLSAKGLAVVKQMIAGKQITMEESGMSKGEWREFIDVVNLQDIH
jgi:thymidylate synthase (FAD)